MKEIRLLRLSLRNFKGIKDFTFAPNGNDALVFGDNATGKTTQFDAFNWLLFDKDSQNRGVFAIKTLDERGNAIPGLEHEVEGVLLIDRRKVTLRKVYKELWTKKRGALKAEHTGHTTDHFIDGVPCSQGEYKSFVASIAEEKLFKLLTSPGYFNEVIDMKERRETLFELCGDYSDAEVIASNPALAKLPAILNGLDTDKHRAKVKARCKAINDEIESIPVRIDEATRSKPDVADIDEDSLADDISILQSRIESKVAELQRIQSGGEVQIKTNRLHEIEGELLVIKAQVEAGSREAIAAARRAILDRKQELNEIEYEMAGKDRAIRQNESLAADKNAEADRLRKRYTAINSEPEPTQHHDENCPACGQMLPADRIEAARAAHAKAIADFRRNKAEQLEAIREQGKAAAAAAQDALAANEELVAERELLLAKRETAMIDAREAEKRFEGVQASALDVNADPAYIAKKQEYADIEKEIDQLRASTQEAIDKVRKDLATFRAEKEDAEQRKALFVQVRSIDKRIEELKVQEKLLAAEYEKLQEELYLLDEFTKTKVNLLESSINAKFKLAEFKLFEIQMNGALKEVCESTFRGVPYGTGLNRGMQTNLGLDIINTLSEHYGLSAPIFIDNSESVTRLIDTVGQKIGLVVSEKDKKLRVEVKETIKEAV